jgi:hypothetical protein
MDKQMLLKNRFNLNELAYDIALLVFPFILERIYTPLMASATPGIPFRLVFITSTVYFLPLLIGSMYNNDFRDSSHFIKRCILYILFACTLFAFVNIMYLVMPGIDKPGNHGKLVLITAIIFLLMGPIAGMMFTRKNSPRLQEGSTQVFLFLFTIGLLPLFYMLVSGEELFGNTGFIAGFFIITGLITGDAVFIVLLYLFYKKSRDTVIRMGLYDRFMFIMRLLAPFCVSFMLVLFNINSTRLFIGSAGVHGAGSVALIIFLYIISGVLPLRIMMMLTPPVNRGNIVLGIISAVSMVIILMTR